MSIAVKQKWTASIIHMIHSMPLETLITRFIHGVFSDRSILHLQWANTWLGEIMFKPDLILNFYQWIDDILHAPLEFELVWNFTEKSIQEKKLFETGFLYCFNRHIEQNNDHMLWKHFIRPLSSLDGYTMCILNELIKRQKKTISIETLNTTHFYMKLPIDISVPMQGFKENLESNFKDKLELESKKRDPFPKEPFPKEPFPKDPFPKEKEDAIKRMNEEIQSSRNQLFLHVFISMLSLPFIASNIPDHQLIIQGENMHRYNNLYYQSIVHMFLMYFNKKCLADVTFKLSLWIHRLNAILCRLHTHKDSVINELFHLMNCTCVTCIHLKPILLHYTVVPWKSDSLDMSHQLLHFHYNTLIHDEPEYSTKQQELIVLNQIFVDSMSARLFTKFSNDMSVKQEAERQKRDYEEAMEPWRKVYRLQQEAKKTVIKS